MPADLPADRRANAQFARTLAQLRHYSLTEKLRRVHSSKHGEKRVTQIQIVSVAERRSCLSPQKIGTVQRAVSTNDRKEIRVLLNALPSSGDLFPSIKRTSANHRSAEFRHRCLVAGVTGVSLHSYRHAWAQRATACGYPQRFAQVALGHSSRAVHEAYAKGAFVVYPALDQYQATTAQKVIEVPRLAAR